MGGTRAPKPPPVIRRSRKMVGAAHPHTHITTFTPARFELGLGVHPGSHYPWETAWVMKPLPALTTEQSILNSLINSHSGPGLCVLLPRATQNPLVTHKRLCACFTKALTPTPQSERSEWGSQITGFNLALDLAVGAFGNKAADTQALFYFFFFVNLPFKQIWNKTRHFKQKEKMLWKRSSFFSTWSNFKSAACH